MLTRRGFIKSSGLVLFSAGLCGTPLLLGKEEDAAPVIGGGRKKALVVVFQRGGMDGLAAVAPYADVRLASLRPKLMMPPPGSGHEHAYVDLDGTYGLHPALASLAPFFKDGRLAIVHAAGNTFPTRSHLDAAQCWESGTPGVKATSSGWLNRALAETRAENDSPFRAVTFMTEKPRTLYGDHPVLAMTDVNKFGLRGPGGGMPALAGGGFEKLYARSSNDLLRRAGSEGFEAMRLLSDANLASYQPAAGADYPKDFTLKNGQVQRSLGCNLRQIAQLLKSGVGVQAAYTETTGFNWDSHVNQHAPNGTFFGVAGDFARSLAAFWTDLGPIADDVVLLTMTEFGRNVTQNETSGTDHGRATCMFVLGSSVMGGKVYGTLPDRIVPEALEDKQDLPITTDFRSVIAGLVGAQLGIADDRRVFPTWEGRRLPLLRT